jgi:hypothetical protein
MMSRKGRLRKLRKEFEAEWSSHYWNFISRHLDERLDWKALSKCPYISTDIIENNLHLPWRIRYLSLNPNMNLKFVKKYSHWNWNWYFLSSVIPMKEILANLDLPWSWMLMSKNKELTMEVIERFPDKNWGWSSISLLPFVNMKVINEHPDKRWLWYHVSLHPSITFKDVVNNPDKPWDWYALAQNPNINIRTILRHRRHPWHWKALSRNRGMTMAAIENNPKRPWAWEAVSENPNLTVQMVEDHHYENWCWESVSRNVDIGHGPRMIELLHRLLQLFHMSMLSENPSVTIDIIESHFLLQHMSWDWEHISKNTFHKEREAFLLEKAKKHIAAYRIQQCYLNAITIPTNKLGEKLINKHYDEYVQAFKTLRATRA